MLLGEQLCSLYSLPFGIFKFDITCWFIVSFVIRWFSLTPDHDLQYYE